MSPFVSGKQLVSHLVSEMARSRALLAVGMAALAGASPALQYGEETTSRLLASSAAAPPESVAYTSLGTVQGVVFDNARAFMGVPYAMPPVNASRWMPPAPAVSWQPNVLQALYDPPGCIQQCTLTEMPPHVCPLKISEDCLYLNVWTPRVAAMTSPAPVLLFIHGGAFKTGYAGGTEGGIIYDASNWVNTTGAVVVTINYRLGAMGFLSSPASAGIGGNVGLMDQEMAMRWVQTNIGAFGGDPARVTLFGQSAGAMSIASHLSRPQSAGLYQGAIIESDPFALPFRDAPAAQDLANVFAQKANCSDGSSSANWTLVEACLRALDAGTLLIAQEEATSDVLASLRRLVDIFVPWVPTCESARAPILL